MSTIVLANAQLTAEKTVFDIKLEKYDGAAKIKIIKEVRGFPDLGVKEAKDLVDKAPVLLKKGSEEKGALGPWQFQHTSCLPIVHDLKVNHGKLQNVVFYHAYCTQVA